MAGVEELYSHLDLKLETEEEMEIASFGYGTEVGEGGQGGHWKLEHHFFLYVFR